MTVTAAYRYEAIRFAPSHSGECPFQIVFSSADFPMLSGIVELTIGEAKDLHKSLGMMIKGADSE